MAEAIYRIVAPIGGVDLDLPTGGRRAKSGLCGERANDGTTSITVRKLDGAVKRKLRIRAAAEGHSLEEEIRQNSVRGRRAAPSTPVNLAQAIMDIVDPVGGIELDLPPRTPESEPPRFDWDEEEP